MVENGMEWELTEMGMARNEGSKSHFSNLNLNPMAF